MTNALPRLEASNRRSLRGHSLLWWLPEPGQDCGWRPRPHRSSITPLPTRGRIPSHAHLLLPSPNQPLLTCYDSEGGTEMHKVIPSTALSKWELKKSPGGKGFVLRTQGQVAVGCHTQEPMPVWDAWVDKFSWLKMHVTLLN